MQSLALAWLILDLTRSPFYLGLEGFANTIPISVLAFWGGVIADRFDRRRLLIGTQWVMLGLAMLLGLLTQWGVVRIWHIILVAFWVGVTQALAWPVYQTVMANVVERQTLSNAIALNSAQFNLARMIGPMAGAFGLRWLGTAGCFYANAASFLAVIVALRAIRTPLNRRAPDPMPPSVLQSFKEGFVYMTSQRRLFWLLLVLASSSVLGVPLVTLLPAFARDILRLGPSGLGNLMGSFGAGAVMAGFVVAYLGDFHGKERFVIANVYSYVLGMLGFALSRQIGLSIVCLFVCGFSMVSFASVINSLVQSEAPDHLRGRAMSLFVFAFGGCMPFGNLLAGGLAHFLGVPTALLTQALALGAIALLLGPSCLQKHS